MRTRKKIWFLYSLIPIVIAIVVGIGIYTRAFGMFSPKEPYVKGEPDSIALDSVTDEGKNWIGEMGTGAMGVMDQKFGSAAAAYSYLIFVLLYVPCISVMGAIARESSRGWMGFSILWGLNIAYSLATLFYQVASYSQHPTYSLVCILAVILFNIVVIGLLRRARSRVDIELLATRKSVSSCCAASTTGDCH